MTLSTEIETMMNNTTTEQYFQCKGHCNKVYPISILEDRSKSQKGMERCNACWRFANVDKRYLTWKLLTEVSSKVKCSSTLDCGAGKQIPHHSAIIQYDHLDSDFKLQREKERAESGKGEYRLDIMKMVTTTSSVSEDGWIHNELKLCRPLCPNCHAIQSRWERKIKYGINPEPSGDFEVETDEELYQEYLDIVLEFIRSFKSVTKAEKYYLFNHPDFDLNDNPDFNILEDCRISKDLFLKN